MISMSPVVLLLILSLAVARGTRLIVDDEIFKPVLVAVVRKLGTDSKIAYLLHCRWCVGMWVAMLLSLFAWLTGLTTFPAAVLLAPASAYGSNIIRSMIEE